MAEYVYPSSDLDDADKLLSLLGSFWSDTYQGNHLVQSMVYAAGQQAAQTHLNFLELISSMSRFEVPIFHTDNWYFLEVKESDLVEEVAQYGETTAVYDPGSVLDYGELETSPFFTFPKPKELVSVRIIMNRITDPSLTLVNRVDYKLDEETISFRENPFENSLVPKADVLDDEGEISDRIAGFWIFRGQYDWDFIYEQFGYVLNLKMKSSEGYRDVVNAVMDAFVEGSNLRQIQLLFSSLCGVPLVKEATETIEEIFTDLENLVIVSDQHVYKFPKDVDALVAVGDTVSAGDTLTNLLEFYEFNRGEAPSGLRALTVGGGLLTHGFLDDLVFENKTVPLVVTSDANGFTKVEFEIGGFPGDVEKFWDDLHARGLAKGQTLANLLDKRTNKVGEPSALALPETINPLQFLAENVLRSHAIVVKMVTSGFSANKLGLQHARLLRKILPPHTAALLVVELEHKDDPVIMDGAGDVQNPGYEEAVSTFPCMSVSESLGTAYLQETVRIRLIRGRCE